MTGPAGTSRENSPPKVFFLPSWVGSPKTFRGANLTTLGMVGEVTGFGDLEPEAVASGRLENVILMFALRKRKPWSPLRKTKENTIRVAALE